MQSALTHLDILRRYAKGDRDFSGLNISGIKLTANSDQTRHKSSNLKVSPKLNNIWQHIRLI